MTPVRMQDRRIFMQELEFQIGLFCLDQTTDRIIHAQLDTSETPVPVNNVRQAIDFMRTGFHELGF